MPSTAYTFSAIRTLTLHFAHKTLNHSCFGLQRFHLIPVPSHSTNQYHIALPQSYSDLVVKVKNTSPASHRYSDKSAYACRTAAGKRLEQDVAVTSLTPGSRIVISHAERPSTRTWLMSTRFMYLSTSPKELQPRGGF